MGVRALPSRLRVGRGAEEGMMPAARPVFFPLIQFIFLSR